MREDLVGPEFGGIAFMEVSERDKDSGTVTTNLEAVLKVADHSPNACKGRSMEHRPLDRTGVDDGDTPLDGEGRSGL
jgi:hypothetical protein